MKSLFRPTTAPDPAILDNHRPLIRSLQRRGFLRGGLSLGALTMLTGCDLADNASVQAALRSVSSFNDRAQALLFDPNKLAPTYSEAQVLKPPRFNAYYDVDKVKPVDGGAWRLELAGLVADKRPWTRADIAAMPQVETIVRHVCVERLGAGREKVDVVLAPHRQHRRLAVAEVGLPFRVKRDVGAVVVDEVELDLVGAGAPEVGGIERVAVRRHALRVGAGQVLGPDRLGRQRRAAGVARLRRAVLPVGLVRLPCLAQALLVGVAVLADDGGHALGVRGGEAEAGRCPVIEHVKCVAAQPKRFREAVQHLGQVVERVVELAAGRCLRQAEAG